jgi:hypothetical protein
MTITTGPDAFELDKIWLAYTRLHDADTFELQVYEVADPNAGSLVVGTNLFGSAQTGAAPVNGASMPQDAFAVFDVDNILLTANTGYAIQFTNMTDAGGNGSANPFNWTKTDPQTGYAQGRSYEIGTSESDDLILALLGTAATSAQGPIVANFDGGDGSGVVDAFPGVGGDGWSGPWGTTTNGITSVSGDVIESGDAGFDPLAGGGNYLNAQISETGGRAQGSVNRRYNDLTGVDLGAPHTIRLDFRVDSDLSDFNSGQRIALFDSILAEPITSSDDTWAVSANDGSTWDFRDGNTPVDTGIAVTNDLMRLLIDVDPVSAEYAATLTNVVTGQTFSQSGLGFRSGATTVGGRLHFAGRIDSGVGDLSLSIDSLVISAPLAAIPEPSTFALAALGLLGLGIVARRRRRK